jgi:hypothetical protein
MMARPNALIGLQKTNPRVRSKKSRLPPNRFWHDDGGAAFAPNLNFNLRIRLRQFHRNDFSCRAAAGAESPQGDSPATVFSVQGKS